MSPPSTNPDLTYFTSLTWCKPLLSDPQWLTLQFPNPANPNRPGLATNYIFTRTLNSPTTMQHIISQVRGMDPKNPNLRSTDLNAVNFRMFVTIGNDLQGWTNIAHGGAAAIIHDQAMTLVVYLYKLAQRVDRPEVTAEIKVKYLRAMTTPGAVVVQSRVVRMEDRRYVVESEIRDEEGKVLSRGSAVFALLGEEMAVGRGDAVSEALRKGKAKI